MVQRWAEFVKQSEKECPALYNLEVLIDVQVDLDDLVPLTSFRINMAPS